ncbi:MAG: hypothetical protein Q4D04_15930 [Clostridia bacterium]|nr:hypothetical protein [Clostridia bacterium]
MSNYLAELFRSVIEEMEQEAENRIYALSDETLNKLATIRNCISDDEIEISYSFCRGSNNLEIALKDYVFDSHTMDLVKAFSVVDIVDIYAMSDGIVKINLTIRNACDWD